MYLPPTEVGELHFRPKDVITDAAILKQLREKAVTHAYYQCRIHPYMDRA